jgi:uncharacterized protein YukJ
MQVIDAIPGTREVSLEPAGESRIDTGSGGAHADSDDFPKTPNYRPELRRTFRKKPKALRGIVAAIAITACLAAGAWGLVHYRQSLRPNKPFQYGYVKCKLLSNPKLKSSRHGGETLYHLHATLQVATDDGAKEWDSTISAGTDNSDDLLKYKFIFDFHHSLRDTLRAAPAGFHDLTRQRAFPALDFVRSDLLSGTDPWRTSDVQDGSGQGEPAASLVRLLRQAYSSSADVYIFGRTYRGGDLGIHDVHMNQGSWGAFWNNGIDDHNDHNDIWQDGALLVDLGDGKWAGYFAAFAQQLVPTDHLGNPIPPIPGSHPIDQSDPGDLAR